MGFVARIKFLALAIRRDGKNLSGIARGDIQSSVLVHDQVPNIFRLGIEEDRGLARRCYLVHFSVRRCADEQISRGVQSDGLSRQLRGFKHAGRFPGGIDAQDLGVGSARGVRFPLVGANLQQEGQAGVGKFGEARGQKNFAVAAQRHSLGCALIEIVVRGLPPPSRVFGKRGRRQGKHGR